MGGRTRDSLSSHHPSSSGGAGGAGGAPSSPPPPRTRSPPPGATAPRWLPATLTVARPPPPRGRPAAGRPTLPAPPSRARFSITACVRSWRADTLPWKLARSLGAAVRELVQQQGEWASSERGRGACRAWRAHTASILHPLRARHSHRNAGSSGLPGDGRLQPRPAGHALVQQRKTWPASREQAAQQQAAAPAAPPPPAAAAGGGGAGARGRRRRAGAGRGRGRRGQGVCHRAAGGGAVCAARCGRGGRAPHCSGHRPLLGVASEAPAMVRARFGVCALGGDRGVSFPLLQLTPMGEQSS